VKIEEMAGPHEDYYDLNVSQKLSQLRRSAKNKTVERNKIEMPWCEKRTAFSCLPALRFSPFVVLLPK